MVTANWDSLVFDLGTDPLRRVPMMDPLKGTAEHTGALLAQSTVQRTAGATQLRPSCLDTAELDEGEQDDGRTRTEAKEHEHRTHQHRGEADEVEQAPATSERGEKLKAELDDLLDEIDEVLEDNAEEFVRNYVQKGGE